MSFNYKKGRIEFGDIEQVNELPEGEWLPISVVAKLSGRTGQGIRILIYQSKIRAIKFQKSVILVDLGSIPPKEDRPSS